MRRRVRMLVTLSCEACVCCQTAPRTICVRLNKCQCGCKNVIMQRGTTREASTAPTIATVTAVIADVLITSMSEQLCVRLLSSPGDWLER